MTRGAKEETGGVRAKEVTGEAKEMTGLAYEGRKGRDKRKNRGDRSRKRRGRKKNPRRGEPTKVTRNK